MKLYPIEECMNRCRPLVEAGAEVYQEWICSGCGTKRMMDDVNTFNNFGKCDACGHITDIKKAGCNYMLIISREQKRAT